MGHWVSGVLLYLHLQVVLDVFRNILQTRWLLGVLPRSDLFTGNGNGLIAPEQGPLEFVARTPLSCLIKQILTDVCFYIPGILMTVFIPTRFGHLLCPFSRPLELRFGEVVADVQLPMETLLYHILIPFITGD